MIQFISILIFSLSSMFTRSHGLATHCPLENGKIAPDRSGFIRGKKKVQVLGKKGASVYSVSDGVVEFIGKKTKIVRITNEDMTYEYFGMAPNLKEGQTVVSGAIIGKLDIHFLMLGMEKAGKEVNPREYINCLEND